jgi:hypothetical protein
VEKGRDARATRPWPGPTGDRGESGVHAASVNGCRPKANTEAYGGPGRRPRSVHRQARTATAHRSCLRLALPRGARRSALEELAQVKSGGAQSIWLRRSWAVAVPFGRGNELLGCTRRGKARRGTSRRATTLPNKRMQLTKLRAAPVLQAEVPPCAPAGGTDGGTASQLIRSVGRTGPRSTSGSVMPVEPCGLARGHMWPY